MNNFEDCILRHIFNNLDIHNIKKISNVCRDFYNLDYRYQCIPKGIYKWIYGIDIIDKDNKLVNQHYLSYDYCFLRYIKDIIYFLDDITIYRDSLYWKKSSFINEEILINNDKKQILKHKVYRVNIRDYYGIVINSLTLKAILY